MLIASPRHKANDLVMWSVFEAADLVHGRRLSKSSAISRSIDAIREFAASGPCYVGVSWGKESVITAHLCRLVDASIPLVHLRCNNHNPDSDAVRNDYQARFPGQPYREVIVDYQELHAMRMPHQELDRLTDAAWYAAINKLGSSLGTRHILGLRAGESNGRRMRCLRFGLNSKNGCAPLGWWSTADVFGYLATEGLPVHPVYAMLGNGRWPRERLRTAEIGDTHGTGSGRREWELEYYGDVIRRLELSSA